jgi:cytochrome c oxidase assembly protein subunit 15
MRALAIASLLSVLVLVSVSAYLRLEYSGIGCSDWPTCYGQIGGAAGERVDVSNTGDPQPVSRASKLHRITAGLLGLLTLGMTLLALHTRRDRLLSLTLLGLAALLTWLSLYSEGLNNPAAVMGNLAGGFAMLGLLGWTVFRNARPHANASRRVRRWVAVALMLLCIQIGLGGLTSANFAATACLSMPDCHGSWLPGSSLGAALDLTQQQDITAGSAARADIHKVHRLVAVATLVVAVFAGSLAIAGQMGATAMVVVVLAALEFCIGVAAILTDMPLGIAVVHNGLAAILLLGLLRLFALCRNRQALL